MKSYLDLIPISAKVHKKQSRMTQICIVLAVFLVTAIFGMADMEIRSQQLQEIKATGDWHVMFSGIDEQDAKMIIARPEVRSAGWYAYYGGKDGYTLSGKSVSISGSDKNVFEDVFPTKVVEGVYPKGKNEVVLTENAKNSLGIQLGDTITLEHPGTTPLRLSVVGFIEGTSKLLRQDGYAALLSTDGFRSNVPNKLYTSHFMIQFSKYSNMQKAIADITQQFQLTDQQVLQNGNLLAVLGQSNNSYIFGLYTVAGVLFIIVLLAGVLMITSSLNSNVMQRTEFFGMLRCIGATKKQIMRFVRKEALQWCKTSIPLGLGMGIVVVWILCAILKFLSPSYFAEMPTFGISWISILFGIAVGIFTVLLAARSPAKKAASVSPLAAVSGNANSVQPIRTAANTTFFKVDTALGIHHAKSSKKNFFLMVGSFALSIILFLCFSVTVDFMNRAVQPLKPWTPDFSIIGSNNTGSISNSLAEQLQDNPKVERVYGRMFAYDVPVKVAGKDRVINLISYEDHQFSWAKDSLLEGSLDDARQQDNKVLVVYNSESILHVGDTLALDSGERKKEVTVAGLLSSSPFDSAKDVETVICSETTFRQLTGKTDYTIIDMQLSKDTTDEDVNAIRSLAGSDVQFSDRRSSNSEARGAYFSFALFIYGFLIIIALITIFNIVNSIAMSVSARIKQYGAMRAIGMSDHQLVKMVMAEAATYAVSGSIVGCMIGLPLHKFLFEKMITSRWGDPWSIPFGVIGIIVSIVIIAAILAVHSPAKRIHNMSIVDAINAG
ncbi:ABC transporter permease [Bacillaceae bacterium SAS-127]|nr:ABC transporter permease [Bacillaceae bacterium SAS-127]